MAVARALGILPDGDEPDLDTLSGKECDVQETDVWNVEKERIQVGHTKKVIRLLRCQYISPTGRLYRRRGMHPSPLPLLILCF